MQTKLKSIVSGSGPGRILNCHKLKIRQHAYCIYILREMIDNVFFEKLKNQSLKLWY